jgi:hypothetical protein
MRYTFRTFVLVLGAVVLAAPASADLVLWDTGAPHRLTRDSDGVQIFVGYSSGNLGAGSEQRWAAMPFRIEVPDAVITQVDVDWFIYAGHEADNVMYIIWNRTGLDRPEDGDQFSQGLLGPYGAGIDDPRTEDIVDDYLHQYEVDIPIPMGDYYLTIYGDGGEPINSTPWLTGGDLQAEDLERGSMWRSAQFPDPGFQDYTIGGYSPGDGMADADDMYNCSFTLYGIPEPSTLCLLGLGLAAAVARRRA